MKTGDPTTIQTEAREWRCFHCDEVFTSKHCARQHFGAGEDNQPACVIKAGAEGSILEALRRAENSAADAWHALHSESSDFAKAYYAQTSRHSQALRATEELGYERGLKDGRDEARSLALEECILAATSMTQTKALALLGLDRASTIAPSAVMREAIVHKLVAIRALGKDES